MNIRDPEYRGMAKLALDRKDEILALRDENEKLKVAVEEAKVKRGQYREILEALLVPTNFIGIEAARDYILEALKSYGLAKVSKP